MKANLIGATTAVDYVVNPDGLFGDPSYGDIIVTRMVFDTSQAFGSDLDPPYYINIWGGSGYGGPQFILSASATINGVITPILSPNTGNFFVEGNGSSTSQQAEYTYANDVINEVLQVAGGVEFYEYNPPISLDGSYSYNLGPQDRGADWISYSYFDPT